MSEIIIALMWGILVPGALWFFDLFIKDAIGVPSEDRGADLCLMGISFNLTTFVLAAIKSTRGSGRGSTILSADWVAIAIAITTVVSTILYVICLKAIAPAHTSPSNMRLVNNLRSRSQDNRIRITTYIGTFFLFFNGIIFALSV